MKVDKIEQCFEKIQQSITTQNHNSDMVRNSIDANNKVMIRLADAIDKIEIAIASGFSGVNNEHNNIKLKYDTTKLLFKWVIFPLIIILGGLVGIKLYWP